MRRHRANLSGNIIIYFPRPLSFLIVILNIIIIIIMRLRLDKRTETTSRASEAPPTPVGRERSRQPRRGVVERE